MSIEFLELGEQIAGIALGEDVGEAISRSGGIADGVDAPIADLEVPRLGPLWFLISEPLRRRLAKSPCSTSQLMELFEAAVPVDVEQLLCALEIAGLVYQRRYTRADGALQAGKWALTDVGRRAAWWPGPELGRLDRCGYAREMASGLATTLGVAVHDIYRGPTCGIAVLARARFCAALDSIGWPARDIARHFGMDRAWVEQGIERWKRVHAGLESARPRRSGCVNSTAPALTCAT